MLDGDAVEEYRLRRSVECIRHEGRLNHDEGVVNILFVENVPGKKAVNTCNPVIKDGYSPIEGSLIRTVIKDLQELTSSEMEHELGIDTEVVCKSETGWVFLPVIGKLLTESDKHSVQPPKNVRGIVDFRLKHSNSCHQDCRGFLIEGGGDAGRPSFREVASNGGHS